MVSRSYIVPVVGTLDTPAILHPAEDEVDRILWVPLAELTRSRHVSRGGVARSTASRRPMFFFELDDETIWGATARILHQLLRVALGIDGPEPPAL